MTSEVEADKFRKMWIEKFDEQARLQGRRLPRDFWEGSYAYRELDATDPKWLVRPSTYPLTWPFVLLTEQLSREVHIYKLYEESVVADNQNFGDAIAALAAAATKLRKVSTQESRVRPEVDRTLRQCASAIEKTRASLEKRWDSYWQDVLFAIPEERMKWWVYFDKKKQLHSIPPDELTKAEQIFENLKYPRDLVRQIDLDKRFQLRVAKILRLHLRQDSGVSLRTISRLTVLTYICGGLRVEGPNRLFILTKPNAKSGDVSVGSVYQKLHTGGVK